MYTKKGDNLKHHLHEMRLTLQILPMLHCCEISNLHDFFGFVEFISKFFFSYMKGFVVPNMLSTIKTNQ